MKLFLSLIATFSIATATYAADIQLQNPYINEQAPNFVAGYKIWCLFIDIRIL